MSLMIGRLEPVPAVDDLLKNCDPQSYFQRCGCVWCFSSSALLVLYIYPRSEL